MHGAEKRMQGRSGASKLCWASSLLAGADSFPLGGRWHHGYMKPTMIYTHVFFNRETGWGLEARRSARFS